MNATTSPAALDRIAQLEASVRRVKRAGAAGAILGAGLLAMGQALPANSTVEATRFVLRDSSGAIRATLAMTEKGPGLSLLDSYGAARVSLWLNKDNPTLFLQSGKTAVGLSVDTGVPWLQLTDAAGAVRTALTFPGTDGGSSGLAFFDANQKLLWEAPAAGPAGGAADVCVDSNRNDADVYVDGRFVGSAPSQLKLAAGEHKVEVKAAGADDWRWQRRVDVITGSNLLLHAIWGRELVRGRTCPGR